MMAKTRMVIVISLRKCNNNIVVKCNELNKSATQPTIDHLSKSTLVYGVYGGHCCEGC